MSRDSVRTAMSGIPRLRFQEIAPGSGYHASLKVVRGSRSRAYEVTEHCHDFYEFVFVLAGEATHRVNGADLLMTAGELVLLQPDDRHSIRLGDGRLLNYINIALPASVWQGFRDMTGMAAHFDGITGGRRPAVVHLSDAHFRECAGAFQRALEKFVGGSGSSANFPSSHFEVCRLLSIVVPLIFSDGMTEGSTNDLPFPEGTPMWLQRACRSIRADPERLRLGLPAFVEAAGVTPTHLARVLKAALAETPTAFINRLRLDRAARLLTTTTLPALDIALECGFEQPSYFYRLFQKRFGTTPQAYRESAARRVAP